MPINRSTDDDLDDLTLPQRPRRSDPRAEARTSAREDLLDDMGASEREFTLSTGTVLALFFGLALICAVFFGFGYSMGHKSALATATAVPDATAGAADTADASATEGSASKPSAASPTLPAIPSYQGSAASSSRSTEAPPAKPAAATGGTSVTLPMDGAAATKPKKAADADPDGQIVETAKPAGVRLSTGSVVVPASTGNAQPAANAATPVAGVGSTYVQIAAVSHKEDADVLLSALRRRGYTVFARQGDADKLIHVQVGPYATKKDAEVMRQKLQGDGYNAILK